LKTSEKNLFPHKSGATQILNLAVSWALLPIEKILTSTRYAEDYQVCFIIGPPRSGTTLLFEYLTSEFECAYLSNIAQRLYRAPVAATYFFRYAIRKRIGTFNSKYGQLTGLAAPSENGRIWRYWIPEASPYFASMSNLSAQGLRGKISGLCRILGSPMIVKYLHFQSEIPRLKEYFPNAVFIHLERDWAENVRSILRARYKLNAGSGETKWFSARPTGWENYTNCDPVEQACAQVILCHADSYRNLSNSQNAINITYENLCNNQNETLEQIETLFRNNGYSYKRRFRVTSAFTVRPQERFDQSTEDQIQKTLERLKNEILAPIAT